MSGDESSLEEPTSEAKAEAETSTSTSSRSEKKKDSGKPKKIYLVPYPKFVFMYPTLIAATAATIVLYFAGHGPIDPAVDTLAVVMTGIFLVVMMANMFVIVFDFPRATSVTLLFIGISFFLGLWALSVSKEDLFPSIGGIISAIRPVANTAFFGCIAIGMFAMYAAILIKVRFNYWELSNNELLHHHGFLSDLKRYPAPNLRVDKEINDVFEFMLLGAGRLILHPSTEKRAIVLDNILFVSEKERELTRMLGSIKVKIGSDSDHH